MNSEIIAEIGQNHNGDLEQAKKLIDCAKRCGADVAKFQVYDARKIFPPKHQNPWFDYNCLTELTRDDVFYLADYCEKVGIEFMASVFDLRRLEWLEEVGVKRYKIASRSIFDIDLISSIIATNKPVLISLGMWNQGKLPTINSESKVDFLYCVSKYPTPLEDLQITKVDFSSYSGFSDHTTGITAACASFVLGSKILEKHLTLDKSSYGPDHECSMTPDELAMIHSFRMDWKKIQ